MLFLANQGLVAQEYEVGRLIVADFDRARMPQNTRTPYTHAIQARRAASESRGPVRLSLARGVVWWRTHSLARRACTGDAKSIQARSPFQASASTLSCISSMTAIRSISRPNITSLARCTDQLGWGRSSQLGCLSRLQRSFAKHSQIPSCSTGLCHRLCQRLDAPASRDLPARLPRLADFDFTVANSIPVAEANARLVRTRRLSSSRRRPLETSSTRAILHASDRSERRHSRAPPYRDRHGDAYRRRRLLRAPAESVGLFPATGSL